MYLVLYIKSYIQFIICGICIVIVIYSLLFIICYMYII
nr:MAG TPA: hypothetical protein [Caudoviricetes sp.]